MPNKAHSVTYSRRALTALVASTAQRSFYQLLLFSTSGNSFPSKQQGPQPLYPPHGGGDEFISLLAAAHGLRCCRLQALGVVKKKTHEFNPPPWGG